VPYIRRLADPLAELGAKSSWPKMILCPGASEGTHTLREKFERWGWCQYLSTITLSEFLRMIQLTHFSLTFWYEKRATICSRCECKSRKYHQRIFHHERFRAKSLHFSPDSSEKIFPAQNSHEPEPLSLIKSHIVFHTSMIWTEIYFPKILYVIHGFIHECLESAFIFSVSHKRKRCGFKDRCKHQT
jgi:hypothetical protein